KRVMGSAHHGLRRSCQLRDLFVSRVFSRSIVPLLSLSLAAVCGAASGTVKSKPKDSTQPETQRSDASRTHTGLVRQQIARRPIAFFPVSTATPSTTYERHLPGYDLQVRPAGMTIQSQRVISPAAAPGP